MSSPASSVDVPVSPSVAANPPLQAGANGAQPPKRKPNRRANTAERRATHNAVERQRRETLNGRFLDLAGLLPNLATVRRPSKSAIVNSSIAIVHAHRRRIALSARALRTLKAESDALRRELNEWRARANLPRVEEPVRTEDLEALMTLEDASWENAAAEERRAYEMAAAAAGDDDGDDGFYPQPVVQSPIASDAEQAAAWNAQLYSAMAAQQQQQQQQVQVQPVQVPSQRLSTPPQMYTQVPTQPAQYMYAQVSPHPTGYFGVEDDASSVGSSEHSGAGYELAPGGYSLDGTHPRRLSLSIPSPPAWVPQQAAPAMSVPVSSGGGSSFHPMAWMM